jgi:hypothetical protein
MPPSKETYDFIMSQDLDESHRQILLDRLDDRQEQLQEELELLARMDAEEGTHPSCLLSAF